MGRRGEEDIVLSHVRRIEINGRVWVVVSASSYSVSEIAIVLMRREMNRSRLVLNGLRVLVFDIKG